MVHLELLLRAALGLSGIVAITNFAAGRCLLCQRQVPEPPNQHDRNPCESVRRTGPFQTKIESKKMACPFAPHLDMCFYGRNVAAERKLYLVPVAVCIRKSHI